jgi:type IV pilus assembly protein PilF
MSSAAAAMVFSVVVLALAGCASSPPSPFAQPSVKPNTSGEESTMRTRARVHTELAAGYYQIRNMSVALTEVNQALRAEPDYGPAHNVAGLIHAELKQDDLARQHFERALQVNPVDPDANNNYGRFLCDRKREAEAIKYFLAALQNPLYQNRESSYLNAGVCSRRRGDLGAAEDYFMRALKAAPNHPQGLYQLADIAYERGAYDLAKEYLVRLERVSRPAPEVLGLGLRIERRLGDRHAVASYSQQLRRQFPDSEEARALLGGTGP